MCSENRKMKNTHFGFLAVSLCVLVGCARPAADVCRDGVAASRSKYKECTPDAGGFGGLIELGFTFAEGACSSVEKGCELDDGGMGKFDVVAGEKCVADTKAATCAAASMSIDSCNKACK
jgi:hypothetical protein